VHIFFDESGDYAFPKDRFDCYVQAAVICPDSQFERVHAYVEAEKQEHGVRELHATNIQSRKLLDVAHFIGASQCQLPAPCVTEQHAFHVRAGQQNTMKVGVHKRGVLMRYAQVRITGPGVRQTTSTGAQGVGTFTFKPARPGRLYVQADVCIGADPLAVLPAQSTNPPGPPPVGLG
jgi:hypothetical protein